VKLYLAHNFGSRFKVDEQVTPIVAEMYPKHEIINPFKDGSRHNEGLFETTSNSEKDHLQSFKGNTDQRDKILVERDLAHIDECNLLVAYIERISAGTAMEIFYAKHVRKIQVHLIFDTDIDLYYHPFLNYHADKMINLSKMNREILTDGVPVNLKVLEAFNTYGLEIALLLAKKNVGYGTSASRLDYIGIHGRIEEKTKRITNIVAKGLVSDGVEDIRETILDIGGYAIIEAMCHDKAFPFEFGFTEGSLLDSFSDEQLFDEMHRRGL